MFDLKPGCVLEDVYFSLHHWRGALIGGGGGEVMSRMSTGTRLEFVFDETSPDVFVSTPSRHQWRCNVDRPFETDLLIFVSGTQAEGLTQWTAGAWVPAGASALGTGPHVLLGDLAVAVQDSLSRSSLGLQSLLARSLPIRELSDEDTLRMLDGQGFANFERPTESRPDLARSVHVQGYRGFRSFQTLELATPNGKQGTGLTLVVGANNAGKSALWESFETLSRAAVEEIYFPESRRNPECEDGVQLRFVRESGASLNIRSADRHGARAIVKFEAVRAGDSQHSREWAIVAIPAQRQFRPYFGPYEHDVGNWTVHTGRYSRTELREGFSGRLIAADKSPQQRVWFDDNLADVLGYVVQWSIEARDDDGGNSHYVKIRPSHRVSHSSEGAGEGLISLMYMIDSLRDLRTETVLAIDEPELSLHPEAIRKLRQLLSKKAATNQIVVFTHSPLMIDWTDIANGARVARIDKVGGESKIHQPAAETLTKMSRIAGSWRTPHTFGTDGNEVFFLRDRIIVVEGQEDVSLIPRVAEQVGVELPGSFFGWGAGGAQNMRHIPRLLAELGFKQVAGILDGGTEEERVLFEVQAAFPDYEFVQLPAGDIRDKTGFRKVEVDGRELYEKYCKVGLLTDRGAMRAEYVQDTAAALNRLVQYFDSLPPP